MEFKNTPEFAKKLDERDPLSGFRNKFYIPGSNGSEEIYFCGNSLGLQPKTTASYIEQELEDWKKFGVKGHFEGKNPWFYYHHLFSEPLAKLTGAKKEEVVVMNTLTTNLHLMMVSFYRPDSKRYKILIESNAFPSDQYAVESQLKYHGYDPEKGIIEPEPDYNPLISTEQIIRTIEKHSEELALVLIGGVNYYTGQYFDLKKITEAAHKAGACAGFDLAHTIGNVPLQLHDWDVDFAVWCTYKYLNSGPGGPGGVFVHEKYKNDKSLPRFAGWWGQNEKERFKMTKDFDPEPGAAGWQLSNAQVFGKAAHHAALDIFEEAGIEKLREKSVLLTGYMEWLINNSEDLSGNIRIITPADPEQRGAQLSLVAEKYGRELYEMITEAGVVADWREPDVIRVAPVPLYNTFQEVYQFVEILSGSFKKLKAEQVQNV